MSDADDITRSLEGMDGESSEAVDLLFAQLYDQLKQIAYRQLQGERPDHTLNSTALVNEAYLKLNELDDLRWRNRSQFFALAAQAMRRILVSHARSRRAEKRGAAAQHVTLTFGMTPDPASAELSWDELITVGDALEELATRSPRQARVAELRLFAGLNHDEVAEVEEVSVPTVRREWRVARAFLADALKG